MSASDGLSDQNKSLSAQLLHAERDVDADTTLANERKAQVYTCFAHDWYQMDMDEEGSRLLMKANRIYPGYFKTLVIEHTKENEGFALVVKNLTLELAYMVLTRMREMKS